MGYQNTRILSNATYETYNGVSGYIYYVDNIPNIEQQEDILNAFYTSDNVQVTGSEFIEDAYEAIQNEIQNGNIILIKYEDFIKTKKEWLYSIIQKEYDEAVEHPEYRYFLINKFPFINQAELSF